MSDDRRPPPPSAGSRPITPGIVLATTYAFDRVEDMARAAALESDDHLYSRWSNPTVAALEARLAELEGAEDAVATASGMAAVSLALLSAHRRGDDLIIQRETYGGTTNLLAKVLGPLGVAHRRVGLDDLVAAAAESRAAATTIYLEIPTNPTIRIPDLPAIRAAAPRARIVVDATFATPVNLQSLAHGADLVVHSATKYLAGHHDVIAGAVVGSAELLADVRTLRTYLGPTLDAAAAWRVERGIETLELRVTRQNSTARELARRLAEHPAVVRAWHPSLPDHPDHARLGSWLRAGGGVLSFVLADYEAARRVANAVDLIARASSLGGVRTTLAWPASVSQVGLTPEQQAAIGVAPGLLRLAVGCEDVDALWSDLAAALAKA